MNIEISDHTFQRLQKLAIPLVDSVEDVILRVLDAYVAEKEDIELNSADSASLSHTPKTVASRQKQPQRPRLEGFRKELWELVIKVLPQDFSLEDIYSHQAPLKDRRPHVQEMEATIRNALQRLRDMGYVEFVARGKYRRID